MTDEQYRYMKRAVEVEDASRLGFPHCGVYWQIAALGHYSSGDVCSRREWIRFNSHYRLWHTTDAGRAALAAHEAKQGAEA